MTSQEKPAQKKYFKYFEMKTFLSIETIDKNLGIILPLKQIVQEI
jgi:hypothetical protein